MVSKMSWKKWALGAPFALLIAQGSWAQVTTRGQPISGANCNLAIGLPAEGSSTPFLRGVGGTGVQRMSNRRLLQLLGSESAPIVDDIARKGWSVSFTVMANSRPESVAEKFAEQDMADKEFLFVPTHGAVEVGEPTYTTNLRGKIYNRSGEVANLSASDSNGAGPVAHVAFGERVFPSCQPTASRPRPIQLEPPVFPQTTPSSSSTSAPLGTRQGVEAFTNVIRLLSDTELEIEFQAKRASLVARCLTVSPSLPADLTLEQAWERRGEIVDGVAPQVRGTAECQLLNGFKVALEREIQLRSAGQRSQSTWTGAAVPPGTLYTSTVLYRQFEYVVPRLTTLVRRSQYASHATAYTTAGCSVLNAVEGVASRAGFTRQVSWECQVLGVSRDVLYNNL